MYCNSNNVSIFHNKGKHVSFVIEVKNDFVNFIFLFTRNTKKKLCCPWRDSVLPHQCNL